MNIINEQEENKTPVHPDQLPHDQVIQYAKQNNLNINNFDEAQQALFNHLTKK